MNIYVILIGALLVTLMVVFGRNPIEARHEAQKNRGGDPLVNAIEDYNAKKHMPAYGSQMPGYVPPATTYRPQPSYPAYVTQPGYSASPAYQQNPYAPATPQNNTNSYYPPAAPGTASSPLQQPQTR